MDLITVVGSRPNFVKAAMLTPELVARGHSELKVETGQHFAPDMSTEFARALDWKPDVSLAVTEFGKMVDKIVPLMEGRDACIVYGDTTSTLAGAFAAFYTSTPLVHVEAGCRSFDLSMPEERNRIAADKMATLLCCPTRSTYRNLAEHYLDYKAIVTGDLMCDAAMSERFEVADADEVLERYGVAGTDYYLATIHRQGNTDDHERLTAILEALVALDLPVLLPAHHRLRMNANSEMPSELLVTRPVPYADMLVLVSNAEAVITDSGGVQREAYLFGTPCVTVRPSTEWPETVMTGWNRLAEPSTLAEAVACALPDGPRPPIFGDGHAAGRIVSAIERRLG